LVFAAEWDGMSFTPTPRVSRERPKRRGSGTYVLSRAFTAHRTTTWWEWRLMFRHGVGWDEFHSHTMCLPGEAETPRQRAVRAEPPVNRATDHEKPGRILDLSPPYRLRAEWRC
jgi:hypothetical protein